MKTPDIYPFVFAILHHLKNKEVEVNCGDVGTILKFAEYDLAQKSVIRGKVVDGMGDCLILEAKGTRIFLNAWSISSIVPMEDPLFVKDVYHDAEFDLRNHNKKRR